MGSSVLAAKLERFGFSNIPIRKTNFEKFFAEPSDFHKEILRENTSKTVTKIQNSSSGGTSVFDRSFNKNFKKINAKKFEQLEKKNKKKGFSFYFKMRKNLNHCILYKEKKCFKKHIEFPIDFFNRNSKEDVNKVLQKKEILLINCDRNPADWLNSTLHQNFHRNFLKVFLFPKNALCKLLQYKKSLSRGTKIYFDDIFNQNFFQKLKKPLGLQKPCFSSEYLDLYGKLVPVEFAETKEDQKFSYLPNYFKRKIAQYFQKPSIFGLITLGLNYYICLPQIIFNIVECKQKKNVLYNAKLAFLKIKKNKKLFSICKKFGSKKFYQLCILLSACQKKSELNFIHGLQIFDTLCKRIKKKRTKINILETGTARGFSTLCLWEGLSKMKKQGTIWSIDKIGHTQKKVWKGIPDFYRPVSRHKILKEFHKKNIHFLKLLLPAEITKIPKKRYHFAFLDAEHTATSVKHEIDFLKTNQKKGDVIFFDDVNIKLFPGVCEAIKNITGYKLKFIFGTNHRNYVVATKK